MIKSVIDEYRLWQLLNKQTGFIYISEKVIVLSGFYNFINKQKMMRRKGELYCIDCGVMKMSLNSKQIE